MLARSLLAFAVLVLARSVRRRSNATEFGGAAQEKWDAYVKSVTDAAAGKGGIQTQCSPQMYKHQGAYRGTIIMFHGFTACPQQFEYMIPFLTAEGFVVLTPLTPGHGLVKIDGKDQIGDLPKHESEYEQFGKEMHEIMQEVGGERVVFGLSLGGTIASYVGNMRGYDRRFVAVPLIGLAGILDTLVAAVSDYPCVAQVPIGWGEPCEIETSYGRAGICDFTPLVGVAARTFGNEHMESVSWWDRETDGGLQMVFVENDGAVSTPKVQELASKFGLDENSPYFCGMDAPIGHSHISPYDSPTQNKYWLDEVTAGAVAFLTKGTPLAQSGEIDGYRRCSVTCTPETCPYTSVAKHLLTP